VACISFGISAECPATKPAAAPNAIEIAAWDLYHAADDRPATALAGAVKMVSMNDSSFISHETFSPDIAGVVSPRARIAERVEQFAGAITAAYPDGELTIVAVLAGRDGR